MDRGTCPFYFCKNQNKIKIFFENQRSGWPSGQRCKLASVGTRVRFQPNQNFLISKFQNFFSNQFDYKISWLRDAYGPNWSCSHFGIVPDGAFVEQRVQKCFDAATGDLHGATRPWYGRRHQFTRSARSFHLFQPQRRPTVLVKSVYGKFVNILVTIAMTPYCQNIEGCHVLSPMMMMRLFIIFIQIRRFHFQSSISQLLFIGPSSSHLPSKLYCIVWDIYLLTIPAINCLSRKGSFVFHSKIMTKSNETEERNRIFWVVRLHVHVASRSVLIEYESSVGFVYLFVLIVGFFLLSSSPVIH